MPAIAITAVFAGFLALWGLLVIGPAVAGLDGAHDEAVAANFAAFRASSFGETPLPRGYVALRPWQRLAEGGRVYVYGPASAGETVAIQRLLGHSAAVGWNDGGAWRHPGPATALPAAIPDKAVVSAIETE